MIFVREEWPEDIDAIRMVNEQAFGQPTEDICSHNRIAMVIFHKLLKNFL